MSGYLSQKVDDLNSGHVARPAPRQFAMAGARPLNSCPRTSSKQSWASTTQLPRWCVPSRLLPPVFATRTAR